MLGANADDVVDALARAEAVKQVLHLPEFLAIGAACKRMRNILKQAEEKGIASSSSVEVLPTAAEEEKTLIGYLNRPRVESRRTSGKEGVSRGTALACYGARAGGQIF